MKRLVCIGYTLSCERILFLLPVPEPYARRVCAGMAALGARGVSLLFASGDGGVGDKNPNVTAQTCFTNDGLHQRKFMPMFPASCP